MTAGVGLFGTLSGFLAQSFLSPSKKAKESKADPNANDPQAQVAEILRLFEAQEQKTVDLKDRLEKARQLL